MASDMCRCRRALWMFAAATAVVILAGRAAAQEPLVAAAGLDEALENVPGLLPAPGANAAAPAGQTAVVASPIQRAKPAPSLLGRWLDLQTGTIATRFRFTETSAGVVTQQQLQYGEQFKGRIKLDQAGAYGINFALGTGDQFVRGWNNTAFGTAAGTPDGYASHLFLKQLFGSVAPSKGVEIQAGGLGIVRGENTEITNYDNDGYIVGERVSVKRPRTLHVDEVSLTMAYLGDATVSSFGPRLHRLGETNYYQLFAAKRFGNRLASSTDITTVAGATTLRTGFKLETPQLRVPTSIRVEQYARFNDPAYGFSICGERVVAKWLTLSAGWVDIDRYYGGLNSDRFGSGRRWFTTDTINLGHELSAHAAGNAYALPNRQQLQLLLTYNVAKGLQRSGVL
jgi:hypothetical protein